MTDVRIGSLCSGYGGLDLGLMAVVGGSVAWHVEYDKHPAAVLDARCPGVPNYGDVTKTDWASVEPVDWLTAGYPCQPFSYAGDRRGADDERHLWPSVADAIRVLRPRRVLLENVSGHLSLGFGQVLGDLAEIGYDAQWVCLRAADVGAPHGRARVFIVAHPSGDTRGLRHGDGLPAARYAPGRRRDAPADAPGREEPARQARGSSVAATDTQGAERGGQELSDLGARPEPAAEPRERPRQVAWGRYEPAIRRWERVLGRFAPDPIDAERRLNPQFVEWMQGLPAGWVTDVLPPSPARKALGNGVVPQQAALAIRLLTTTHIKEATA